ncbi:MAG: hypothetical protein ACREFP_18600 [Acetobacteraceae bacterium]
MRRFGLVLCVLVGMTNPGFGKSTTIHLRIALDWSKLHEQEVVADRLQKAGLFPLPMIFVQGKLRGLAPSGVGVESTGNPAEIDIGVAQLVERPLYVVQIQQSTTGGLTARVASLDLAVIDHSSVVEGNRAAVVLKGITHSSLKIAFRRGVAHLLLPAAPVAALAAFAMKTKNGMAPGHIVPLVLQSNKRLYPPFPQVVRSSFGWEKQLHSPDTQPIYKETVDRSWTAAWLPAQVYEHLSWSKSASLITARRQWPIVLRSVPQGADIYVSGFRLSGAVTNTTMQEARELWDDISLRMKHYLDCPIVSCSETVPPENAGPPIFTCKLQRQ